MSDSTPAIEARGLVKTFGDTRAVDGVDLEVRRGAVYGVLGLGRAEAKRRADDLLEAFDLVDAASKLVKNFSGGMRRRLDIAASIVVTPELLFLDEPTTGLDPRSRNQVWDIIRALAGQGTTILLCTQYLDEADQLAERIAVSPDSERGAEAVAALARAGIAVGDFVRGQPSLRSSSCSRSGCRGSSRRWAC